MFWGDGQQRGFLHQIGDVIEHVFRPTAKRQEMLLQEIITKLDRENSDQEIKKINGINLAKYRRENKKQEVESRMKKGTYLYRHLNLREVVQKKKTSVFVVSFSYIYRLYH